MGMEFNPGFRQARRSITICQYALYCLSDALSLLRTTRLSPTPPERSPDNITIVKKPVSKPTIFDGTDLESRIQEASANGELSMLKLNVTK